MFPFASKKLKGAQNYNGDDWAERWTSSLFKASLESQIWETAGFHSHMSTTSTRFSTTLSKNYA